MITNLFKAAVGAALLPGAAAVDIVCMPGDAIAGKEFATRSKEVAATTKENLRKVLKP